MENINEEHLDIAIGVGTSLCKELDICCDKEGKVIYKIYQKLQELHPYEGSTEQPGPETEQPQ